MQQPQSRSRTLLYLLIFACAIALIFWIFRSTPSAQPAEIPLSQVITMSQSGQIKEIEVNGQWLDITGKMEQH